VTPASESASYVHGRALWREPRRLTRVREEGDRLACAGEHEAREARERLAGVLGEVGQRGEVGQVAAALLPRREGLGPDGGAGRGRDPRGRTQARLAEGVGADQEPSTVAAQEAGGLLDRGRGCVARLRERSRSERLGPRPPLAVGGQDQRRDPPRRRRRRLDHRPARLARVLRRLDRARPADGAGERDDVRRERRVEGTVRGRVVADPVDDGRAGAARVVQVREPVGKARSEVQKGRRRPAGHPRPPVGRARADALEQPEHRAQLGHAVEGRDDRHLGGAGVREAHLHAGGHRRLDQAVRARPHPSAAVVSAASVATSFLRASGAAA
jgi:hypothetical protein